MQYTWQLALRASALIVLVPVYLKHSVSCYISILLYSLLQISGAVCFLLSPAASYTTGVTVAIDGAWGLYKKNYEVPDHEGKWPLGVHSDYVKSKL